MFEFLLRMRIRRRLFLGFGCLLLLALMIGLGALARMDRLDERTRASYEQPFALAELTLQAEQTVERIRRMDRDLLFEDLLAAPRHSERDGTASRRARAAAPGAARRRTRSPAR